MTPRHPARVLAMGPYTWALLAAAAVWPVAAVYLYARLGVTVLALPMWPVALIGLGGAFYLAVSASARRARKHAVRTVWREVAAANRAWGNAVAHMVHDDTGRVDNGAQRDLIRRHMAWVRVLAAQLWPPAAGQGALPDLHYLEADEIERVERAESAATQIMQFQGAQIRQLTLDAQLDAARQTAFMRLIDRLYDAQGAVEQAAAGQRLASPVRLVGKSLVWLFIAVLPLGLLDVFSHTALRHGMDAPLTSGYLFVALVPCALVISGAVFVCHALDAAVVDTPGRDDAVPSAATLEAEVKHMIGMDAVPVIAPHGRTQDV